MKVKAQEAGGIGERREGGEREAETRGTVLVGEAEEEDPNVLLRESSALGTRKKRI